MNATKELIGKVFSLLKSWQVNRGMYVFQNSNFHLKLKCYDWQQTLLVVFLYETGSLISF